MNHISPVLLLSAILMILSACEDPVIAPDPTPTQILAQDFLLPEDVLSPPDNPQSPAKVELGRMLFWDPILSGEKDVACVSCHHPDFAYADGRDLSIGVGGQGLGPSRTPDPSGMIPIVKRNSPTVLNTAFNGIMENGQYMPENAPMFWDIRAKALEGQALGPPRSLEEMRGHAYIMEATFDSLEARLKQIPAYVMMFQDVFGGGDPVNMQNVARAIGAFERTLLAHDSRFDQYAKGDAEALSEKEIHGFQRFLNAGCTRCHKGPMFSEYRPHINAIPDHPALAVSDSGIDNEYKFRTPTLRNVGLTAPYFHNGMAESLEAVLHFYLTASGQTNIGNLQPNPLVAHVDEAITDLTFTVADVEDIAAWLRSLTDEGFDRMIPESVPSGLKVGGAID